MLGSAQEDSTHRVLIVDDDADMRTALTVKLQQEGFETQSAADGFKALPKLASFAPHVVVTNLCMPGLDGLELLRRVSGGATYPDVIMITGQRSIPQAVEAMRGGATDYVVKPFLMRDLVDAIKRSLRRRALGEPANADRPRLTSLPLPCGELVGQSALMQQLYHSIRTVAATRVTVLIGGESGTGKELVARSLHELDGNGTAPFVTVNCAALCESLLESELFGHERGSFTGATQTREGRFVQANNGTLFLDEIGEISPVVQAKLLRVLQERAFERVGGNTTINVNVRLIAATNRDMAAEVRAGRFREDLYYRINVVQLRLPALRQRREDIPALAHHFLGHFSKEHGRDVSHFTDDALNTLMSYSWPGNVRELRNAIEHAVVFASKDKVEICHLPLVVQTKAENSGKRPILIPGASLADIEYYAVCQTMELVGGSTKKAAQILGISQRKVQYTLRS